MLQRMGKRLRGEEREDGFTLIELMVVVLIIAILIAIAIPTFLGARKRAQDRAAQSSLRNTLSGAKTIFTDNEDYTKATTTALAAAEPSLSFVATGTSSAKPTQVSVNPKDTSTFYAAAYSKAGRCYYIKDTSSGGTSYGTDTSSDGTDCTATAAESGTFNSDSQAGWTS